LKNEQTTSRAFQFNARTKIVDINGRMAEDFLFMQNPSYSLISSASTSDMTLVTIAASSERFSLSYLVRRYDNA
jgi:hypothetical protein